MKRLLLVLNAALLALVLLLGWGLLSRIGMLPSLADLLGKKPLVIDDTPVVVQEIRAIAQLLTQSYYSEWVYDSGEIPTPPLQRDKRLILIAKGEVVAGFDLSRFDEKSIERSAGKVRIHLPPPQILDVIVNPSGIETFIADGDISFAERVVYQEQAKEMFRRDVDTAMVLRSSAAQGRKILEKFFHLLGFAEVEVVIAGETAAPGLPVGR